MTLPSRIANWMGRGDRVLGEHDKVKSESVAALYRGGVEESEQKRKLGLRDGWQGCDPIHCGGFG